MRSLYPFLLLLALGPIAFVGCDSAADSDAYAEVLGRWERLDDAVEEDLYLNITDDELVVHFFVEDVPGTEDCFERDAVEVVSRDGDEWTIRDSEVSDPEILTITRDGADLAITFEDGDDVETERYERSTRTDFTPLCEL